MVAGISLRLVVRSAVKDDPYGIKVIDLLECHTLGVHLMPYRVWGLDPLPDLECHAGCLQGGLYRSDEIIDLLLLVAKVLVDLCSYVVECIRFLISEPDVFHFRFDSIKTKSVGKRNEYEHGLAENLVSLVLRHELNGPAVMQTVCKLDQNHPYVIIECQEDTLEVFGLHALLLGFVFIVEYGLDLCKTFHECRHFVTEELSEVVDCVVSIFDHVMQQCGYDRFVT